MRKSTQKNTKGSIFKKVPQPDDLHFLIENITNTISDKLDPRYIESKYEENLKKSGKQSTEIQCLNESVRQIFKELSTSTTATIASGISKFIKRPHATNMTRQLVTLHKTFDELQEQYFITEKSPLNPILLHIFFSKCICNQFDTLGKNCDNAFSIHWYHGDYNNIIDAIQNENDTDIYWMDDALTWDGYCHEPIVVIPIDLQADIVLNAQLIKSHVSSIGK